MNLNPKTEMHDFYVVWHGTEFMPKRQRVFTDDLTTFAARNPPDAEIAG